MKVKLLIAIPFTFIFSLTACAPAPAGVPRELDAQIIPEINDPPTRAVTHIPTTKVATMTLTAITTQPVPATATETSAPNMTLTINTQGELAPFLADRQGRSLYVFLNDSPNSTTSTCVDDCAVEWPPLFVTGTPAAGEGVNASLLETLARDDGSIQATYNGWPLHYYNMDTIPGTTYGQALNGAWFLVSPGGEPLQR